MSDSSWQVQGHPKDHKPYYKCETCGLTSRDVTIQPRHPLKNLVEICYRHEHPDTCIRVVKGQPISDVIFHLIPDERLKSELTPQDHREIQEIAHRNALRRELQQAALEDDDSDWTVELTGPRDD